MLRLQLPFPPDGTRRYRTRIEGYVTLVLEFPHTLPSSSHTARRSERSGRGGSSHTLAPLPHHYMDQGCAVCVIFSV